MSNVRQFCVNSFLSRNYNLKDNWLHVWHYDKGGEDWWHKEIMEIFEID